MASADSLAREMVKAQAITQARFQQELEGTVEDVAKLGADFYEFVSHPKKGVVHQLEILQRNVEANHEATGTMVRDFLKIPGIEERLDTLEDIEKKRKEAKEETRKYGVREVLIPTFMAIMLLLAGAAVSKFLHW